VSFTYPAAIHGSTATTATTTPSVVTLQPASPSGGIPGDASDPADFWGIGVAIVGIVIAILLVRFIFRHNGTSRGER
jgi:hypothetical protein